MSLCAVVTTCAPLDDPKLHFYILTPVTLKSRSTGNESVSWCADVRCTCVVNLHCMSANLQLQR